MSEDKKALSFLENELSRREKRTTLSFDDYLERVKKDPRRMLRSIFQLFHDMVQDYVEAEEDESSEDPESIGFVRFDCSKLLVEGADNPFFPDTPFANRFVIQGRSLRQGFQQNRMYAYDGPSGSGKSTFMSNLLRSFESYTSTKQGRSFEAVWEIDENVFSEEDGESASFRVPCPSHDYPILLIPKKYRAEFLDKLLPDDPDDAKEIKRQIFSNKEYAWIFQGEACTICKSIFWALFEKLGSIQKVLQMVRIRPYRFDRRTGEGISVFNPGDTPFWGVVDGKPAGGFFANKQIQDKLNEVFGVNVVRYMYSPLAKTNNGIYVLMDVKGHNEGRLLELHNVISEGVHKVGDIEEHINSLFFALMNPEDKSVFEDEKMKSFQGRIQYNHITYVLEPVTEANIYRNIFGQSIDEQFLPRVLENFAKVVISSRMNEECEPQQGWLPDMNKYKLYCDKDGLLLRMALYSNRIPDWLSEEDRRTLDADTRRAIIAGGQKEGSEGFSGRDSIAMFSSFLGRYGARESLINMNDVVEFFKRKIERSRRDEFIPKKFLSSLVDAYDYAVLNEVKEALYFYNRHQVSTDILNYLCATSYDIGDTISCKHTGNQVEVTPELFIRMAEKVTGEDMDEESAMDFASDIQKKYVTIIAEKQTDIKQSDLYKELLSAYTRSLKEGALEPFIGSSNFREAVKVFGTDAFNVFERRIRDNVSRMLSNLKDNFGYSEQGAKEICLYVLDNNLVNKFSGAEESVD